MRISLAILSLLVSVWSRAGETVADTQMFDWSQYGNITLDANNTNGANNLSARHMQYGVLLKNGRFAVRLEVDVAEAMLRKLIVDGEGVDIKFDEKRLLSKGELIIDLKDQAGGLVPQLTLAYKTDVNTAPNLTKMPIGVRDINDGNNNLRQVAAIRLKVDPAKLADFLADSSLTASVHEIRANRYDNTVSTKDLGFTIVFTKKFLQNFELGLGYSDQGLGQKQLSAGVKWQAFKDLALYIMDREFENNPNLGKNTVRSITIGADYLTGFEDIILSGAVDYIQHDQSGDDFEDFRLGVQSKKFCLPSGECAIVLGYESESENGLKDDVSSISARLTYKFDSSQAQ